jgi:hypothetical protein
METHWFYWNPLVQVYKVIYFDKKVGDQFGSGYTILLEIVGGGVPWN